MLVAMSLTFVACEQPDSGDDKKPAELKSNCSIFNAQYAIDEFGAIYAIEIITDGLEVNGQTASGSGDNCLIMMYAKPQEDGYPVAKTYEVVPAEELSDDDTECVVGGMVYESQPIGTYAYVIEDGEGTDGMLCIGGTIKFEGNATQGNMIANLEFESAMTGDIIEREYIFSGAMDLEEVTANAPAKIKRIK